MNGWVAVTDRGWYERLSRTPGPKDANFWRPSTRAIRLAEGTPFLFKLRAPDNAIAGFGFFAGFTILPDWLAWETFGEANGVGDLATLRARLSTIQEGARIAADPSGRIGCSLIAEARFFPKDQWIRPPSGWHRTSQTGETHELSSGEGLRIWQECLQRVADASTENRNPSIVQDVTRYGEPTLHRPRLGQGIFRVQVLNAYERACAVTGEHSLPVLEAAHIRSYALGGAHEVTNGLVLRTDLHRLFDRGYATVDEQQRFVIGRRLKEEFANGRSYYNLHGQQLTLPSAHRFRPTEDGLAWHRENVFLG